MQRIDDLAMLPSRPRTTDPQFPSDGRPGSISEPEDDEAGDVEDPGSDDDVEDETEEIEVGDPKDGP
jgi:hypothetical protein